MVVGDSTPTVVSGNQRSCSGDTGESFFRSLFPARERGDVDRGLEPASLNEAFSFSLSLIFSLSLDRTGEPGKATKELSWKDPGSVAMATVVVIGAAEASAGNAMIRRGDSARLELLSVRTRLRKDPEL